MASKLFQKTAELSADAQISRKVGPAGLLALKSSGISSTTTVKADAFFKNNWSKMKSFTKSIPTYFQKPYSMGKIVLYSFIFLGLVLLSIYLYKTYFTKKEGFENNITIVISRYNEDLEWLNDEKYIRYPITIYNKGINDDFYTIKIIWIIKSKFLNKNKIKIINNSN